MTRAAANIPQFTYHEWPDGPPPLQFKPQQALSATGLARQWSPHYDLPSPGHPGTPAPALEHNNSIAPRPFVWDSVNQDYFCYDAATTDFVYAKLGRIHYDTVKKEYYRGQQRLKFAMNYPDYRVYQSGEMWFFDSRRQDWYAYDLNTRRIIWRDQKWWPFPQKFEPPNISSITSNAAEHAESPQHQAGPTKQWKDRGQSEQPRIVEVTPFDVSTVVTDIAGRSLPGVLQVRKVMNERCRSQTSAAEKDIGVVSDDEDIIYEVPPRDRSRKKHRVHRRGTYDLQDLVDKTMRQKKKRYSWF